METGMENDDDVELNADELEALEGIAKHPDGPPTPVVKLSQRLLDHGLVVKDDRGVLVLTTPGLRLLGRP
jgi:hypothetical protein